MRVKPHHARSYQMIIYRVALMQGETVSVVLGQSKGIRLDSNRNSKNPIQLLRSFNKNVRIKHPVMLLNTL